MTPVKPSSQGGRRSTSRFGRWRQSARQIAFPSSETKADQLVIEHLGERDITRISWWIFNCYVLWGRGGSATAIVDPGLPTIAVGVLNALGARNIRPETTVVLCTHGHSDHLGGIATLAAAGASEILLPATCRKFLDGHPCDMPGNRQVAKILPVFDDQPFHFAAVTELAGRAKAVGLTRTGLSTDFTTTGWLSDESVLADTDWRVLHTPGHSDDSTSLYRKSDGTLVSGDAVLTTSGRAWFNPELSGSGSSSDTELRIRGLCTTAVLPGHGLPVLDDRVWSRAISHTSAPQGPGALNWLSRTLGVW